MTSTVPFLLEISSLSFPPGKLLRLLGLSLPPPPLPRPLISLSTLCAARNGSTVAPKRHPLAGHATRCSQPSQSIRGLDLIIIRSSHDRPSVPKRAAPLYPSLFSTILQDHSCPPSPPPAYSRVRFPLRSARRNSSECISYHCLSDSHIAHRIPGHSHEAREITASIANWSSLILHLPSR